MGPKITVLTVLKMASIPAFCPFNQTRNGLVLYSKLEMKPNKKWVGSIPKMRDGTNPSF